MFRTTDLHSASIEFVFSALVSIASSAFHGVDATVTMSAPEGDSVMSAVSLLPEFRTAYAYTR